MQNQRDYIISKIIAGLSTADPTQGAKHDAKSTKGAAFAITARNDGDAVNLYVRREPDVDCFAHILVDCSVRGIVTIEVWSTSSTPTATRIDPGSFTRPSREIEATVKVVRKLAGAWLNVDGGVKSMSDAELAQTVASVEVADA